MTNQDWLTIALIAVPILAALLGYGIARWQGKDQQAALQLALEELKAVTLLLEAAGGKPVQNASTMLAEHPTCTGPGCKSRLHSEYAPNA